jgi:hypothetical protein
LSPPLKSAKGHADSELERSVCKSATLSLHEEVPPCSINRGGTPPAEQFNQIRYRLIFDYAAGDAEIQARLQGLELYRSQARVGRDSYIPIRFVAKEKLAFRQTDKGS